MADYTIKQDDTRPMLVRYLKQTIDGVESGISLSTASAVKFIMKRSTAPNNSVTGTATIITVASGQVGYLWQTGDTSQAGLYNAEFEIKWSDGGYETVPNDSYFSIEIVADLGGDV
jgi:hypothetical protein